MNRPFSELRPLAICGWMVIALISWLPLSPLPAQTLPWETAAESQEEVVAHEKVTDPAARRAEVQQQLRSLQSELTRRGDNISPQDPVFQEIDTLAWLDLTYSQILALDEEGTELKTRIEGIQEQQAALARFGLPDPPPYSWLQLDELKLQQRKLNDRKSALESRATHTDQSLSMAHSRLEEAQQLRRQAEDNVRSAAADEVRADRRAKLERARLQCEARQAALDQLKLEIEVRKQELAAIEAELELLRAREELVVEHVAFTREQLDSRLQLLDDTERELQTRMATGIRELALIRNLASADDAADATPPDRLVDPAEIREAEIGFLRQMLRELVEVRAAWRWRYEMANGLNSIGQIRQWQESLHVAESRIAELQDALIARLDQLRDGILTIRKQQLENGAADGAASVSDPELRQKQLNDLNAAIANINEFLAFTRAGQGLLQRALEETSQQLNSSDQNTWFASAAYWAQRIWNYELTVVDDRSITVAKILSALGLLLGGLLAARYFSRVLGSRLLPRLGINPAGAAALQSIVYYGLIGCFSLVVLELVNVPITGFAFMGGAIAIGVGFGSQNILNNFISGLILLAERPIRIGDLVEIDGLCANIEHIGARSTRVRTGSNLEIVVPNSRLLENNLTNWTLSNNQIRVSVSVGVAYGSPVREVLRLLREVADDHAQILDYPEPIILFKEFGDNALLFECHFWVKMRTQMEAERIQSELRCQIDERLAEAKITIAFPQRDVHLDTSRPLEIALRDIDAGLRGNLGRAA